MKFYTIEQVAKICSVSQKTIRRKIASRELMAKKVGTLWRIDEDDLKHWLDGRDLNIESWNDNQNTALQLDIFGGEIPVIQSSGNNIKKDIVNWINISDYWDKKFNKSYNFIDLFSGAGGLSLGLELAGFTGIAAVEFEKSACETYKNNFNHPVISDDIREHSTKKVLYELIKNKFNSNSVDLICGGFPCQGFSLSGYRIIEDERNSLYKDMIEIIEHIRPSFVLMENVIGLRSMLEGKIEEKIINDLNELNYNVNVTTLNAADYYVPQLRNRVIFIANNLNKKNYQPKPLLTSKNYKNVKNSIEDLMYKEDDSSFNHVKTKHSLEMQERLKAVPEGESLYNNYSDAWKKCPWEKPSCTIKENHGGVNIHPILPRVITVREMARLQSFPDNFIFKGSKKWQMVQVGNAVPPLLGKAIGLAIRKSLEE